MGHGPSFSTVTGAALPSSSKTCVMPTFCPSSPRGMESTFRSEATVWPGPGVPVSIIALDPMVSLPEEGGEGKVLLCTILAGCPGQRDDENGLLVDRPLGHGYAGLIDREGREMTTRRDFLRAGALGTIGLPWLWQARAHAPRVAGP